jgi:hypothetical protein
MLPDTSQDPNAFKFKVTDQESNLKSVKNESPRNHDLISISENQSSQRGILDTPRMMTCGEIYRTQFP